MGDLLSCMLVYHMLAVSTKTRGWHQIPSGLELQTCELPCGCREVSLGLLQGHLSSPARCVLEIAVNVTGYL